jgi:hypothetical protein
MRACAIVLVVLASCAGLCAGCDGDDDDDGYDCVMQTIGISGSAPDCAVWLECGESDAWELDCVGQSTGDGMCTCYENGEVVDTVPYQDDFCPADYDGDMEPYVELAADVCGGWPYP